MNNKNWWDNLEVRTCDDGSLPHIPEKEINKVMPDDIKPMWENWINGQTGLHCDDGDFGVYTSDWYRFVEKLKRNQPLVDAVEEWD